jgi:hypothetical protein
MKFTFWAIGAPLLLVLFGFLLHFDRSTAGLAGLIAVVSFFWGWIGFWATLLYWIVRLVRYAWRDKPATVESAPESGRIFGRLQ